MAVDGKNFSFPGLEAGADLSALQYELVALDANGRVVTAGADSAVLGVLYNKPDALGKVADVRWGDVQVIAGVALNEGDPISADATGRAGAAATNKRCGMAITASSAAGEHIRAWVQPHVDVT